MASYSYSGSGALLSVSATPAGGSATTLFGLLLYSTLEGQAGLLSSAKVAHSVYTYTPTHDPLLRFNSLTWTLSSSGATVFGASRSFDNVSNVATVTTMLPAGTDLQAFCYDEQNRLTWTDGQTATGPCGVSITTGSLAAAAYGPGTVTYDTLDRMTSTNSGANSYSDSAHLHAGTGIGSYFSASYDAAGDMTCRSTTSNTQCSTTAQTGQLMTHDGEGARVALQVNGSTPTYYVGSLEELSGSSVTKYLTGGSQGGELPLVERVGTGGALAYLAGDLLGSVDVTLDGSGNVTSQQLFLPFGNSFYSSGTPPTAKAFTNQRKDATSGLYYYNARYYDPTGRVFVSADTVRDGQNPYAYVHWNPETYNDPTGHCWPICAIVAAVVVAVVATAVDVAVQAVQNHGDLSKTNWGQALTVGAVAGVATGAVLLGGPLLAGAAGEAAGAGAAAAEGAATVAEGAAAEGGAAVAEGAATEAVTAGTEAAGDAAGAAADATSDAAGTVARQAFRATAKVLAGRFALGFGSAAGIDIGEDAGDQLGQGEFDPRQWDWGRVLTDGALGGAVGAIFPTPAGNMSAGAAVSFAHSYADSLREHHHPTQPMPYPKPSPAPVPGSGWIGGNMY